MIAPQNQLIEHLSLADRIAFMAATQEFEFGPGYVFSEAGSQVAYVHFICAGIASAVATMEDGRTVETFMVGREGAVAAGGRRPGSRPVANGRPGGWTQSQDRGGQAPRADG